jgi:hypothetical protein
VRAWSAHTRESTAVKASPGEQEEEEAKRLPHTRGSDRGKASPGEQEQRHIVNVVKPILVANLDVLLDFRHIGASVHLLESTTERRKGKNAQQ